MKFYGEDQFYQQNSQGYDNGYCQNPQQGYDNGYAQNPQQGYDNGYYQNPQQGYDNGYNQVPPQQYNNNPNFPNQPYNAPIYHDNQMMGKPKAKKKSSAILGISIGIAAVCLGFAGIAFLLNMLGGKGGWALVAFGFILVGAGVVVFAIENKGNVSDMSSLVFSGIGLAFVIGGLMMIFDEATTADSISLLLPYMILGSLALVGLVIVIAVPISKAVKKKRCNVHVNAVVVEIVRGKRSRKNRYPAYYPVYEYFYNGVIYREHESAPTNIGELSVGQTLHAFVNPKDPTDVYIEWKGKDITAMMIGAVLIFISLITIAFAYLK